MAPQGRYWLLTINDGDDDRTSWVPPTELSGQYADAGVQWLRGQKEIGTDTGRPHWQLFVSFTERKRLNAVKELFGDRAHCELSRSKAAIEYVFKDDTSIAGTRFELGRPAFNRSNPTDWESVVETARRGDISSILTQHPDVGVRFYASLKHIARDHMVAPPDLTGVCGLWIWGPPGVGKSHYAREHYKDLYLKMMNKWWDGYQPNVHKNVLIDDFDRNGKCLGHHLKIWADKFSFLAECKGHSIAIRPNTIIVTSNYRISTIWDDDDAMREAIERRFYVIYMPFRTRQFIEVPTQAAGAAL